ncbi:hypothetical protein VN97_g11836 [Penicillium thymicola]|uniref:Uncharacterized protein n=1 Tax=Penicillium thymicola TaxID=293382 RepID=A0AAI9X2N5_PENTH|nr:hypothetical protein VN97_g11836 [Penicillium thymicola]
MHRRDVADKSGGTDTRGEKRREEREKKVGGDLEWRNVMGKEALRDYKSEWRTVDACPFWFSGSTETEPPWFSTSFPTSEASPSNLRHSPPLCSHYLLVQFLL